MFVDVRVFYEKCGRLKYISHLDVSRLMQRALKRSGLPVWYSEGFNPHIYLTFALPLALGLESQYEVMDFRLTEELPFETVADKLGAALPEGMRVLSATPLGEKPNEIGSALFEMHLSSPDAEVLAQEWNAFLAQEQIIVEKKTKKGRKTIDIKPDIQVQSIAVNEGCLSLRLLLPAGSEKNISPFLVLDAFTAIRAAPPKRCDLCKIDVFTKDGRQFR